MKQFLLASLAIAVLLPQIAIAAELSFQPSIVSLPQKANYTVTLMLDTEGESINAVEGTIAVSSDIGNIVAVSDSGSIVTYWINRPEWNQGKRTIEFRGAIPGGFSGKGILFSVVMPKLEKAGGQRPFVFNDLQVLRNDGLGTKAEISVRNFEYGPRTALVDGAVEQQLFVDDSKKDNIPPEVFSPQISRDDQVFDGNWFIVFATQDKQSGIDHYEVQETRSGRINSGNWKRAESPYRLTDQELHSFVYVIAIDRQGNERVIKVFPRSPLPWYRRSVPGLLILFGAIILIAAGINFYGARLAKPPKLNT